MNRKNNSKNSRRARPFRGQGRPQNTVALRLTNEIVSQPVFMQTFRFRASAAIVGVQIFRRDLLNLMFQNTTASVAFSIIRSIRVIHIKMVAVADGGAGNAFNTISFTSQGGTHSIQKEYLSEGSASIPGIINIVPPRNTELSFWSDVQASTLGDPLFQLSSLTSGVTIDVKVLMVLVDGINPTTLTTSGLTAGTLYTNYLDNSNANGTQTTPVLPAIGRINAQAWG